MRPHCCVSTVDLKLSVKHPFGCITVSPLLFALFVRSLNVLDAGAWHIQTSESSTRQNHTQEDSVQSLFREPCSCSDTSWHDRLIKVLSKCHDKLWRHTQKKVCIHTVHSGAHIQRYMKIYSTLINKYAKIDITM